MMVIGPQPTLGKEFGEGFAPAPALHKNQVLAAGFNHGGAGLRQKDSRFLVCFAVSADAPLERDGPPFRRKLDTAKPIGEFRAVAKGRR